MHERARIMRTHLIAMLTALAVAFGATIAASSGQTADAQTTRPTGPLVPDAGVLLGGHVDPNNREYTAEEVTAFEEQVMPAGTGRTLAIDHRFVGFEHAFPTALDRWDVDNGRTPMITWEPFGTDLQSIASGEHDALIRQRARDVAAFGAPAFLRFAHEMNGDWYPWSGIHNSTVDDRSQGPARYVAAWQHVHGIFEAEGAANAVWVWAPNADSVPTESWNHWTHYYPGDGYVDWVGIDGYNWGNSQSWSSWASFETIFANVYADYAATKPIMISETSSTELGGSKAAWIDEVRTGIRDRFPSVAALVWFQVDKEQDWRVDSSASSLESFRALAADPYFAARPAALDGGTQPQPEPEPDTDGTLGVGSLTGTRVYEVGRFVRGVASITAVDAAGVAVPGVEVDVTWTGTYSGAGNCLTDGAGTCQVSTPRVLKKGAKFTATVTALEVDGTNRLQTPVSLSF